MVVIISYKKVRVYKYIIIILITFISLEFILIIFDFNRCRSVFHNASDQSKNIDLLQAYKDKNEDNIKNYFKQWRDESDRLTKTKYKDKAEESLYGIYRAIFHPYYLDPLCHGENLGYFELDLIEVMNQTPYVVTQNEMLYIYRDFSKIKEKDLFKYFIFHRFRREELNTLSDFYPDIELNKGKVLHLTEKYKKELVAFLGSEEKPFGKGSIMAPAKPKGETLKRYEFIRRFIPVLYGHWGGYWHLSTHPEITFVYLDTDFNQAVVEYRIGYNFGYAEVKKVKGKWIFIKALMCGIE